MDSKYLYMFRVVAREQNITKAADALFISKQALSKNIQNLEIELNCALFNRVGKNIFLNENGRKLLEYSERICNLMDEAENYLKKDVSVKRESIAMIHNYFVYYFFNIYSDLSFSRYNPYIIQKGMNILEQLYSNELLAIIDYARPVYNNEHIRKQVVGATTYKVFVDQRHPWFHKKSISLESLKNETFLCDQIYANWMDDFSSFYNLPINLCLYDYHTFLNAADHDATLILNIEGLEKGLCAHMERDPVNWTNDLKRRNIPIENISPRPAYIYWLDSNDEEIKPILSAIKKYKGLSLMPSI